MDHRQQEVISRAKSLRQRFADSRSSASASFLATSPLPTARWQHHKLPDGSADGAAAASSSLSPRSAGQLQHQSSAESDSLVPSPRMSLWRSGCGDATTPAGSKSPSPSRTPGKRPSSVSWMMTSPRGHSSRPATPTATYQLDTCAISSVAAAAAAVAAATAASPDAQQVRQMSDDFAADLVVDPFYLHNSKVRAYLSSSSSFFFPLTFPIPSKLMTKG